MNWTLQWTRPDLGLVGIALLVLALAAFGLRRWPAGTVARAGLRGLLFVAGLAVGVVAMLDRPPEPLTMAECLSTLASETGLAGTAAPQAHNPPPPWIGLGTGPSDQTYYQVARGLVQEANARGVPLVNIPTNGSFDNLAKAASPLNMALVFSQGDALEAATPEQQRQLRMVMALYQEEVHVLTRRIAPSGKPLRRLSDLNGLRVLVSERSSGSAYTAGRLMKLAGIQPAGAKVQAMSSTHALCSVLVGEAEAMVVVSGQPVGQLRDLQRLAHHPAHPLRQVQFLPLTVADLRGGAVKGVSAAFYEPARIERRSYPWAFEFEDGREQIDTLAVRALLMAYDFSPRATAVQQQKCAALSTIVKLLKDPDVTARLCQLPHHRKWCQIDPGANVPGWQANTCL